MRTVMIFKSEKARKFLLEHGEVYTFRAKQRKSVGKIWINDGYGRPKIADGFVSASRNGISPYDLRLFVSRSGFSSLDDWLDEICLLNSGRVPSRGYLYYVSLKRMCMDPGCAADAAKGYIVSSRPTLLKHRRLYLCEYHRKKFSIGRYNL